MLAKNIDLSNKSILVTCAAGFIGSNLVTELLRTAAGVLPSGCDFEAHKKLVPMQAGDVPIAYADASLPERDFCLKPSTSLREGLRRFAEWYHEFYQGK